MSMNPDTDRKKTRIKKLLYMGAIALVYIVMYVLGNTVLENVYMFNWMSHANFWLTWLIPLGLALGGLYGVACLVTAFHVLGGIVGQVLGDYLYQQEMAAYEAEPYNGFPVHQGVFIWLRFVVGAAVVGLSVHYLVRWRRLPRSTKKKILYVVGLVLLFAVTEALSHRYLIPALLLTCILPIVMALAGLYREVWFVIAFHFLGMAVEQLSGVSCWFWIVLGAIWVCLIYRSVKLYLHLKDKQQKTIE